MVASSTLHIHMWEMEFESLRWRYSSLFPKRWKESHSLVRKASLTSSYATFDVLGWSWVSQWDRPHDVFHMIVDLCQVLNPCSARWRESEVAILTNQEGDRWASCCSKPIVSLRVYTSMGSSLDSIRKIGCVVKECYLTWDIICIFMSFSKPSNESYWSRLLKSQCHVWKLIAKNPWIDGILVPNMWLLLLLLLLSVKCPSRL